MNNLPFSKPGRFYRGNLHTHSTRSEGRLPPDAVFRFYRDMGYDFLALTDHFMEQYRYPITDTTPYRTDDFTTILGAELHAPQTLTDELWHILAVGLPHDFAPNLPGETGPLLAARALEAGAFVAAARGVVQPDRRGRDLARRHPRHRDHQRHLGGSERPDR
ncbi:MAG: hypothetical protein U0703_29595 [Anaerolineae bacterium]